MRLKNRLSLAFVTVTSAALMISFVIVSIAVYRDEMRDLDRVLLAQAHAAAYRAVLRDPMRPAVLDGDGEAAEPQVEATRYEAVYSPSGDVVSATMSFADGAPAYASLGVVDPVPQGGLTVDLAVRGVALRGVIVPVGARAERLLYALPRKTVDADTGFLYRVFSILFVATIAVVGLVASLLGSRLSRDVNAMADVARAVGEGDLGARVGTRIMGSTETRSLARDLDRMIGEVDALVVAQQTFVSHASHELRSPIAALRGELQLSLRRPRTKDEYKRTIEETLENVDLLGTLAEDLLTLARVQRGVMGHETTALRDTLGDALRMARGAAAATGIHFREPDAASLSCEVAGRRADVARALRNLLDNAVAHSKAGGTITIDVMVTDAVVSVSVKDEGPGVSTAEAGKIFSPLFRGSREQADGTGTGLGLAIAREIARAYGGDVRFDAEHTPGARFILELAIAAASETSSKHPPTSA